MPDATVRGIKINYEIIGTQGPWISLNPGSRRNYSELLDISRKLAESGYRILLHDRRNCGASEVAFDGSASEHEVWADDLNELGRNLDALPLYVGGSSAGARLAILLALRHPDAVKGMLLWRVTGGQTAVERLAENYYGSFIKMAEAGGMQAVADSEHFRECIKARPANKDRLLSTDPTDFIKIMDIWRDHFLQAAKLPIIGATEDQLKSIQFPVCIIAGNDVVHPPATAHKITSLIPRAELHEGVVEKRDDDNLLRKWDEREWKSKEQEISDIFAEFLRRAEPA